MPQGPEHRRDHRDKQEESNEAVLDQDREEDVVGYHLLVDRRFDGCLERSRADADQRVLARHLQAGHPDRPPASEMASLDVGPGAGDACDRRFRNDVTRDHERPGNEGGQRGFGPEPQPPKGQRNHRESHERCEDRGAGSREENGCHAKREVQSPQPCAAPVGVRQAHVPRHGKTERERQAELVGVLVQRCEARDTGLGAQGAREKVVDRDERGDARSHDIGLKQCPLAGRRPRDLPDQPDQHDQLEIRDDTRPRRLRINRPEAAYPSPEHKQPREHVKPGQWREASSCQDIQHTACRCDEADNARDGTHHRQVHEHVPGEDEDEAPERTVCGLTHGPAGCSHRLCLFRSPA